MSMATQKRRSSKIASGTWGQIFPPSLETQSDSLKFVKKLLAIGISNIMYLRAAFPEFAFDTKNLDGLPLKVLNARSDCTEGRDLCQVVQSATEAIEKAYLRELILAIFLDPEKPEDAVETYTFHFDYNRVVSDGASGDVQGAVKVDMTFGADGNRLIKDKDDIYKRTVLLIRQTMQLTQHLDSLPENAYITVKLTYYDEHTPSSYEPLGFTKTETEFKCDAEIEPILTSLVKTKFHRFQVKIRSREFEDGQLSLPCSENLASQAGPANTQNAPVDLAQAPLDCACQAQGTGDEDEIFLLCVACHTKQHGSCFLIFSQEQVPEHHLCHTCAAEYDVSRSTESKLHKMMQKGRDVEPTCLYRRSLVLCARKHRLLASDVQAVLGIEAELASQLFDKLVDDNVIVRDGDDEETATCGTVQLRKLKNEIGPRYLGSKASDLLLLLCKASGSQLEGLSPVSQLTKNTKDMSVEETNNKRSLEDDAVSRVTKKKKGSIVLGQRLKI